MSSGSTRCVTYIKRWIMCIYSNGKFSGGTNLHLGHPPFSWPQTTIPSLSHFSGIDCHADPNWELAALWTSKISHNSFLMQPSVRSLTVTETCLIKLIFEPTMRMNIVPAWQRKFPRVFRFCAQKTRSIWIQVDQYLIQVGREEQLYKNLGLF
jgi:hypothetical protein